MNVRSGATIVVVVILLGGIYAITSYQGAVKIQEHVLALDSTDTAAVVRAVEVLGSQGRGIVPRLEHLLSSRDPLIRSRAVMLIGMCGERTDSAKLLPLLMNDEDSFVRRDAALALAKLRADDATGALVQALSDQEDEVLVRVAAATALGDLGAVEAVPALVKALASRPLAPEPSSDEDAQEEAAVEDTTEPVRIAAVEALGRLRAEECVQALHEAADEAVEAAAEVRTAAAHALGNAAVGNDDESELTAILEGLLTACADSVGDVRIAAVQSLGKIRFVPEAMHVRVNRALTSAEADHHYWVREAAKDARRNIGPLDV